MERSNNIEDEIERKWLLRNNPFVFGMVPDEIHHIQQWYITVERQNRRIRKSVSRKDLTKENFDVEWVMIHKESVSPGVNKEHHYEISEHDAEIFIAESFERKIDKIRWVKYFDGFKIEVDCFQTIHLIMMEIELPSLDHVFEMPKDVIPHIICEVTGDVNFNNFNLAYKQ